MPGVGADGICIAVHEYPKLATPAPRCPHREGLHPLQHCVYNAGHSGNCLIIGLPDPLKVPRASDIRKAQMLKAMK